MTPWDRLREMAAGALPRQIEYTTPQLPPEAGPLDRLAALGADVGATLLEASAAGQGAVQSAYGNAFAPLAAQGNQPFIPPAQQAELAGLIAAGATGQQKFEAMQAANPFQSGIGDLAADIASDPISWIPGGLPAKGLAALKAAGATGPATQSAAAILKALDVLDTGPGKLVAGAIKAPIEGVKFLSEASKATRVAQEMRGLEDLVNYVKPAHSWQVDLADHFGGTVIPDYPGVTRSADPAVKGAVDVLADLEKKYRAELRQIKDPASRAAALQLKGQVDQLMESAYTRAFLTREGLRADYGDDVLSAATAIGPDLEAAYKEIGQGFEQAFGSAAQAIQAGRFSARQLAERAVDAAADPALMPQLDQALRRMTNIVSSYRPAIRDVGVEERLTRVAQRNAELAEVVEQVKGLVPLPDDLATLVPQRYEQLKYLDEGRPALLADLPARFAGQDELVERVLDEVQTLARKRKDLPPDADLYGMALESIRKQRATEVGLNALPGDLPPALQQLQRGIGEGVGLGTGLLKEFMLTTGAYPISNLAGALGMSALKGVKPPEILKRLPQHLGPALQGKGAPVVGHDVQNWLDLTDQPLHGGLLSDVGPQAEFVATQDWADKARKTASEKIGSIRLGLGGATLGGIGGDLEGERDTGETVKGALIGGALGAGFPKASRYVRGIAAAVESAAREAAFLKGAAEHTATAKGDLGREVVQALAEKRPTLTPGPGGIGRVVNQQGTPNAQMKQTLDDLRAVFDRQGGLVSPTTLQATLIKNGMDLERARQLGHSWQSKLDDASQAGVKLAHEINFDYQDLNNFEQFMRTVVPFSTWALKAYPFFAKQLAERPALAVGIRELNDMTEEERTGMGLTGRFSGSVPLGAGDVLFGALLGRDVKAFFNPLRSVVPFSDVGRNLQSVQRTDDEAAGPLTKPIGLMETFLPGFHPAIKLGMRLSGQLGNAPAEGLSFGGAARPLAALTSVDLNAPGVALERKVRQGFGQEPVDFKDSAILKRIDELAVGQTGHTTRDKLAAVTPYQQAKVTRKGPIWDQAKGEVERETAARSTVGFLGGPVAPQALLSPEEEAIRGARRPPETGGSYVQFDPGAGEELRERIKRGEAGVAASPRVMRAMLEQLDDLYGENIPAPAQRLLEVGTNEAVNNLQSELYQLQVGAEPLIGAYGSQASTKAETDLRNVLGLYHNPRALLADDPAFMRLSAPEQDRIGRMLEQYGAATPSQQRLLRSVPMEAWLKAVQSRKEVMRKNQPALDDYLNYEAERRGAGTIEDYFATRK